MTYQNHRQVMTHSNLQLESRNVVMTSFISTVASIELEGTSVELVLKDSPLMSQWTTQAMSQD